MPGDLLHLPARGEDGALHVVVETPAGSRAKLKYSPSLGTFVLSRPLALGVSYPFDWGFVPGTCAPDGDPVDALVLSDAGTFPGVVLCCQPVALLQVEQNSKRGGRERNDRIIAEPVPTRRPAMPLADRVKKELEAFFVAATFGEHKALEILGWADAEAADRLVRDAEE